MQNYRKIILIAVDTLNVDHLGCYGYNIPGTPTTPFLDSLAEEGTLFQKHYATDVPTPSSFTSLFCGIRGVRHNIIGFNNKYSEFHCPTPLQLSAFRGGWMWRSLPRLVPAELKEFIENYPQLRRIFWPRR